MVLAGTVDRTALPTVTGMREGTAEDRGWMDDLDRALRGGPHGTDHDVLAAGAALVVDAARRGYAYTDGRRLSLLAARDEATARRLLWECLARATSPYDVPHVTPANPWAVDVGLTAGLGLATRGYLGVRGMEPPRAYVHHGALL